MKEEQQAAELRQKINELNRLPEGYHFRQDKVWQQLENKLQQRKSKTKPWWFAVAAAALLLLCSSLFFLLQQTPQPSQTLTGAAKSLQKKNVKEKKKKTSAEVAGIVAENKTLEQHISFSKKKEVKQKQNNTKPQSEPDKAFERMAAEDSNQVLTSATSFVVAEEKKESMLNIEVVSAKRKLRQVHINDLTSTTVLAVEANEKKPRRWISLKAPFSYQVKTTQADNLPNQEKHPSLFNKFKKNQ